MSPQVRALGDVLELQHPQRPPLIYESFDDLLEETLALHTEGTLIELHALCRMRLSQCLHDHHEGK